MINTAEFFTYEHLFTPAPEPVKYGFLLFIFFGALIMASLLLYYASPRKKVKFLKDFYRRLADAFFYLPILMILYIFIRQGGLQVMSQRIIFIILTVSWLIWLVYLLYYRLAVVSRLYFEYNKKKKEEKYIRNGKN